MTFEEFRERDAARYAARLAFNARVLELARHNGFEIALSPAPLRDGSRLWYVPPALQGVAGNAALVVRP